MNSLRHPPVDSLAEQLIIPLLGHGPPRMPFQLLAAIRVAQERGQSIGQFFGAMTGQDSNAIAPEQSIGFSDGSGHRGASGGEEIQDLRRPASTIVERIIERTEANVGA